MGGFAMSDNLTPRIEQLAPELEKIISTSEPIEHLADGFGGAQGPAEGPLWWEDGGYLLFSDIHNNRRMKYQPGSGVSLFLEPTNRANGLTRDLQGRLVACENDSRRLTRQEADGSITVVANSFRGRRLNRPNDVVVRSDGCIYFTDPWSSTAAPEQWDLQYSGVYRMTPDLGTLRLLARRKRPLHQRHASRPHQGLRAAAERHAGEAHRPGVRRSARARARRARRHEGRCRGQRLLRRRRRHLGYGPGRQAARPHRARGARHHQPRVRRRRLEDALHHQPQPPRRGEGEDPRHQGAGRGEMTSRA